VSGAPVRARKSGRLLAALGAALALVLAVYTASTESMPEFHAYDGWWMLLGAAVAVALGAPLVWRWPRQRSLPAIVLVAILGSWLPFLYLAHRGHVPLLPRLKGAWFLMGADVIGAAVPVGVACLWLALREPSPGAVHAGLPRFLAATFVKQWWPTIAVALAGAAVYARTVGFEFVYDDVWVILNNPRLHSLARWREILITPWWTHGLYRPFTSLTLAANWVLGAGNPAGFHLANLLLHALASALVYVLAVRWLPRAGALAAALLFAVHPVHVEAVANVVGRAEVLATVCTLVAALLYLRHGDLVRTTDRGPWGTELGVMGMVLLALASKESAFAAPGLLLVLDWLREREAGRAFRIRRDRHASLWIAVVVLTAAWLVGRAVVLGGLAGDQPAPGLKGTGFLDRALIMLPVVPEYLRLLFVPMRLSADYSPDFLTASPVLGARAALGFLVLGVCVTLAVLARGRAPLITAGLAWVGVSLLIVANLIVPTGILLAERTLYLPSVGVCLMLGWLWSEAYRRQPPLAGAALGLVLLAFSARSVTRVGVWKDNTAFFHHLVQDAPGSYRAAWVGAMLSYIAGDSTAGERQMRQGLRIYSGNGAMWRDFAKVMEKQRRWRQAADYHWAAFVADPTLTPEASRAVAVAVLAGELDTAQVRLARAERTLSPSADLTLAASHLALARGDAERATTLRRGVARAQPDTLRFWVLTAEAATRAGDCDALGESIGRLEHLSPVLPILTPLRERLASMTCPAR
jgi:Tfp pilus assembly protein PilF